VSDERKKFTLYLHPDKDADSLALNVIESVPRTSRGELFRNAFISGLALQQLDPRLPILLATLFSKDFTADQLIEMVSQTTGWKPSQVDIREILAVMRAEQFTPAAQQEKGDDELKKLEGARQKMAKLF